MASEVAVRSAENKPADGERSLEPRRTPQSGTALVCSVNDHMAHRCDCYRPEPRR
ncbi:hypothetical protein [Amycolatopsis thermoflava]|uniref:hypothetical protein n=1 Tax=Amycolatopsis thermoflava TaxID=84480 RepID=UPI0036667E7E